jgi:hypothetical protein
MKIKRALFTKSRYFCVGNRRLYSPVNVICASADDNDGRAAQRVGPNRIPHFSLFLFFSAAAISSFQCPVINDFKFRNFFFFSRGRQRAKVFLLRQPSSYIMFFEFDYSVTRVCWPILHYYLRVYKQTRPFDVGI